MQELDLLILGAGWTSTFLIPLARHRALTFCATTRDGHEVGGSATLKWTFDPDGDDSQFSSLPLARNVLITFPLKGTGPSAKLVQGYEKAWEGKLAPSSFAGDKRKVHFVQLGSTGIWQGGGPTLSSSPSSCWVTRKSSYDTSNARAEAEDELLSLGGCVLNLAGLWGGARQPRDWVGRVAKTKEDVRGKRSLHLVHGLDVARGLLAVVARWEAAKGQRWMLTDGFVYDWWSLFVHWGSPKEASEDGKHGDVDPKPSDQAKWVYELMVEEDVRALPRSMEALGRCYDSREFWDTFGIAPVQGGV